MIRRLILAVLIATPLLALDISSRLELGYSLDHEITGTVQFAGRSNSWGFTAGRIGSDSFFAIVHEYSIGQRLIGRFGVEAGLLNAAGVLIERNIAVTIQGGRFGLYAILWQGCGVGINWSYRGVAGHKLSAQYVTLVVQFDI